MKFQRYFSLAGMLLIAWSPQDQGNSSSTPLPKARQVIEQHIQASGGFETLESPSNVHFRSNVTASAGSDFVEDVYQAEGKFHSCLTLNDGRVIRRWSNTDGRFKSNGQRAGTAGEQINQGEIRKIVGAELQEYLRLRSSIVPSTRWLETCKSIKCESVEEVDNRKAYKLHFVEHDGNEVDRYFDVETGLCIRKVADEEYYNRRQTVVRDYLDYQKMGEILVPKKQVAKFGNVTYIYEIELFETDIKIPKGTFDLPAKLTRNNE